MVDLSPITTNTPKSEIFICKNVPFGRDYASTILFNSWDEQRDFFRGRAKYVSNHMKPFTLGDAIRVPYPAEQMYECNYIYFTSQTSSRHWSAFITNIKRVNENVADIYYEIDVLQSWQLKWSLNQCMVLREHVQDDSKYLHIQPEPIDTGEYVLNRQVQSNLFNNIGVVTWILRDSSDVANMYGGIFSGAKAKYYEFDGTTFPGLKADLDAIVASPDRLLAMHMFAGELWNTDIGTISPRSVDLTGVISDDLDGYRPRNNKLFSYPYNFIYVTDYDGNAGVWKYELFNSQASKISAMVACAASPIASPITAPNNYGANVIIDQTTQWDYKVAMQPFPMCSWASDTYRAYIAQNSVKIETSLASDVLQFAGGAGLVAGGIVSTMSGAGALAGTPMIAGGATTMLNSLMSGANTLQEVRNHELQPTQAKGSIAGDTMYAIGKRDFYYCQKCVKREYAKVIDRFFDMYGYAVNEVKRPDIKSRPSWNFIQTENSQITGEIALADIEKLNAIFNRGVTFWHGDYVGDYSRSNN